MTGRANWRFSHVLGWGGSWEGVSWMKEGEDILNLPQILFIYRGKNKLIS